MRIFIAGRVTVVRTPQSQESVDFRLRPPTGVSVADVASRSARSSAAPGRGSRPRCSRDGRATLRWPIARPIDHLFAAQRQTSAARSACAKSGPERALRCLKGIVSSGGTEWTFGIARAPIAHHPGACFCHPPTRAAMQGPMDECAHPHARAPWQAEQMVRDVPPGHATATGGATGGGGGGGRCRGRAPTHSAAGRGPAREPPL